MIFILISDMFILTGVNSFKKDGMQIVNLATIIFRTYILREKCDKNFSDFQ